MTLTRWSPVSGLAALEVDRLHRMFETAFSGEPFSGAAWTPATDIVETATGELIVRLDLPELKRDEIKVAVENNVLTVEGERRMLPGGQGETYHRIERGYGTFRRSFTLPSTVDTGRVNAGYQDGVLTVSLPRREDAKPRQIEITG